MRITLTISTTTTHDPSFTVTPKYSLNHASLRRSSFFFSSRRRHTRLQGDWSSDVCSSDLRDCPARELQRRHADVDYRPGSRRRRYPYGGGLLPRPRRTPSRSRFGERRRRDPRSEERRVGKEWGSRGRGCE